MKKTFVIGEGTKCQIPLPKEDFDREMKEINNVQDLKLSLYKIISDIGTETESDRLGLVDEVITTFSYVSENCQSELDINEYVDISKLI